MSQLVHFQGNPVAVAGSIPQAGSKAQAFTLVAKDLSDVTLAQFAGKRKVLNIFPSIDTGVCAASVRKFNQLATEMDNTVVLCISADLPFAQSRFCGAEGLSNVITLSTLRSPDFLEKYGVSIAEGPLKGLAARAVLVIDENDTVLSANWLTKLRSSRITPPHWTRLKHNSDLAIYTAFSKPRDGGVFYYLHAESLKHKYDNFTVFMQFNIRNSTITRSCPHNTG